MKESTLEAIRTLGTLTRGRFNPRDLSGPAMAGTRAKLMATLLGVSKVPQVQAGVNAIEAELLRQLNADGERIAGSRRELAHECIAAIFSPTVAASIRAADTARMESENHRSVALVKCGNFYEAWMSDARTISGVTGMTLKTTSGVDNVGVPYHELERVRAALEAAEFVPIVLDLAAVPA